MQPLIDSSLMDATWRTVAVATPDAIRRMQKQCASEELTGFVIGFTSDLQPDALGLALYVRVVVAQAFHHSGAKFRKVKPGAIMRAWTDNAATVHQLKAAGFKRSPFAFPTDMTTEPAAMQYIVDALTEFDESDPVAMTDDEFWVALQVLKTFCDCMHSAAKSRL